MLSNNWKRQAGLAFGFAAMFLLGGCATSAHFALDPAAANKIEKVDVVVGVTQSEINPTVEISAGGAATFGVLGALVDSAVTNNRAENAQEWIQPIRDALLDYDFDEVALREAANAFSSAPWFLGRTPRIVKGELDERYGAVVSEETDADAVLFLTTEYLTSANFEEVRVFLRASMFPMTPDLDPYRDSGRPPRKGENPTLLKTAMYRNVFEVRVNVEGMQDEGHEKNAAYWASDNGALAKRALDAALQRAMKVAVFDVQQVQGNVAGGEGQLTHVIAGGRRARLASGGDSAAIYRYPAGGLYSGITLLP